MNKVILLGRLTKDPELTSTTNGISRATFTLAVDRRFKNSNGERETDFINCVAWRQTAEFISKWFGKGKKLAIVGSLQVRTWVDNEGKKHWVTEVIADEAYFVESNTSNNTNTNNTGYSEEDEFDLMNFDELPF